MTLKNQWKTIKDNWIIAIVIVLILLVPLFSGTSTVGTTFKSLSVADSSLEMTNAQSYRAGGVYYDQGFAPDVSERKITKTTSLSTEIKRGQFKNIEEELKSIIKTSDSFLLNENVNVYGEGIDSYYSGNYQIKVETDKYDAIIAQLKALGEVKSFNENMQDITATYTNIQTEISTEEARLKQYQEMYQEAKDTSEKIQLTDKIFDLERTIKYLKESLNNKDLQIDYSTIYLSLEEKRSNYTNIAIVKFSQLIRNLVNSFNGLLSLIFSAIPWIILIILGWFGYKVVKKR